MQDAIKIETVEIKVYLYGRSSVDLEVTLLGAVSGKKHFDPCSEKNSCCMTSKVKKGSVCEFATNFSVVENGQKKARVTIHAASNGYTFLCHASA